MSTEQLLKLSADTLADSYPTLDRNRIQAGLLLTLAGRVKQAGEEWSVSGTDKSEYQVVSLPSTGWGCTCKAYPTAPEIDELGRVCKHILAVTIAAGSLYPKPASVWELLERIVRAQVAPNAPAQGKLESLNLPGTKARLVRPYRSDDRDVLCLKVGRTMSAPLVEWRTNRSQQRNVGEWRLTTTACEAYDKWIKEITK